MGHGQVRQEKEKALDSRDPLVMCVNTMGLDQSAMKVCRVQAWRPEMPHPNVAKVTQPNLELQYRLRLSEETVKLTR